MSDNNPNDTPGGGQESPADLPPFDPSLLSAFLDDELAAPERAKVLQRLAVDPTAKATLESMRQVRNLVSDLPKWTGSLPDLNYTADYADASDDEFHTREVSGEVIAQEGARNDDDSQEDMIVLGGGSLEQESRELAAAERVEQERLAAEQAEQERIEQERLETERLAAQQAEAERLEQERVEADRLAAEQAAAERAERERLAAERAEQERLAAEQAEQERIEQERLEAERAKEERLSAEQAETERAEQERLEAVQLEQEQCDAFAEQREQAEFMEDEAAYDGEPDEDSCRELAELEVLADSTQDPVSDDEVEQFIGAHRDAPASGSSSFGTAARALAIAATLLLVGVGGYLMWPDPPALTADNSNFLDSSESLTPSRPATIGKTGEDDFPEDSRDDLDSRSSFSADSPEPALDPFDAELRRAMGSGRGGPPVESLAMQPQMKSEKASTDAVAADANRSEPSGESDIEQLGRPMPNVSAMEPQALSVDVEPEMLQLSPPGLEFADSLPPVLGTTEMAADGMGAMDGGLPDGSSNILDSDAALNELPAIPDLASAQPALPSGAAARQALAEPVPKRGMGRQPDEQANSQPAVQSAAPPPMSHQEVDQLLPDPPAAAAGRQTLLPGENFVFHSAAWQKDQLEDAVKSIAPLVGIGRRRLPKQLVSPVGSLQLRGELASGVAKEVAAVLPAAAIVQTPSGVDASDGPRSLVAFVSDVEADAIIRELSVKRRTRLSAAWLSPSTQDNGPRAILIISDLAPTAE